MKSSPSASDEIKSAFYHPALAGFHRVAISSAKGGFIPTKADLTEKDSELYPILSLFLARRKGFEPPTFWFVAKHSIQLSYRRICDILSPEYNTIRMSKSQQFF